MVQYSGKVQCTTVVLALGVSVGVEGGALVSLTQVVQGSVLMRNSIL